MFIKTQRTLGMSRMGKHCDVQSVDGLRGGNDNRLLGIDMAKIIGLVIVMLSHTDMYGLIMPVDNLSLPVFWICAGYTTVSVISLRRKAVKLLVPYFVMSMLCLLFTRLWRHEPVGWLQIEGVIYARAFIGAGQPGPGNPFIMSAYNSVLWFLPSLFTAYCLYKCILAVRRVSIQAMVCLLCLVTLSLLRYLPVLLPWSIDMAFFYAPLMWLGGILRRQNVIARGGWILALVCAVLYVGFNYLTGPTNYSIRDLGAMWPAALGCAVTGVMALMWVCSLFEGTWFARVMSRINREALYIFGMQLVFINLAGGVFAHAGIHSWMLSLPLLLIICFAGGIATGWLYRLAERFLKKLLGRRQNSLEK